MKMKTIKFLCLGAPVAAGLLYSYDVHKEKIPMTYSILNAAEQQMELEQVQIIFRHGARTPTPAWSNERFQRYSNIEPEIWDKDELLKVLPGTDIEYTVKLMDGSDPTGQTYDEMRGKEMRGGCYNGQLTFVGQQHLYDLGKHLSERYIKSGFISPSYEKDEIYVRTSYFQRTIRSAVCLLSGLYGKENLTEPVLIKTKELRNEDLMANFRFCNKFGKWFNFIWSEEGRSPEEKEKEDFMNMLMGKKDNGSNTHSHWVADLIRCRLTHGLNVPRYLLDNREMINKGEIKMMEKLFGKGRVDILRCNIGSFIETLCRRIAESMDGSSQPKMLLYSAHDWTILSLLIALGIEVKEFPPFASNIILELYKREDGKRFIHVILNDQPIMFDGVTDEGYLPIEIFLDIVERYRVLDFWKECADDPEF